MSTPAPLPRPSVGDPAPEIELSTIDGQTWRLADQVGHPTVVIFHRHAH